jgi:hypothetical protein
MKVILIQIGVEHASLESPVVAQGCSGIIDLILNSFA